MIEGVLIQLPRPQSRINFRQHIGLLPLLARKKYGRGRKLDWSPYQMIRERVPLAILAWHNPSRHLVLFDGRKNLGMSWIFHQIALHPKRFYQLGKILSGDISAHNRHALAL